ncbi:hypothetical protein [Halostagnicola kamekurae]|uniref:Uncharacterized protein n=1 Tax=Halostagnicola kamekurae TaxID=619731 RepID=A0A1I6U6X9_9EURY|nr:hypothetical protein [Halostagnicola kamekurae]SFS97098.1 hypothetical protein SAMN04488556_3596 [Halostagnicola kamekurae]
MDAYWKSLRTVWEGLEPGSALVTPVSERLFDVESIRDDRLEVRFRDSGERRSLLREQFDVLADRLEENPIPVATLAPGVEPYAAALSLGPVVVSDGETLSMAPDEAVGGESPHLRSPEEARTRPRRVHDDAVLLADLLDRVNATDPGSIDTEALTDLYVLLSDVQRGADRVRGTARNALLERLGPDQRLHGRFGTVRRTTRERRIPKDDETIFEALDERDIPRAWVTGVDPEKLDVVLAVTDLDEATVYDVDEQVYVQKTGVDEDEKFAHLQGLAERLEEIEGGEEIHDDLLEIERRIDEALSAG